MTQPRLRLADDTIRKPPLRIAFNKTNIEAAKPRPDKEVVLHDSQVPGLIVRIRPSGKRSFYVYKRHAGRPVRLKLGDFPFLTVAQARQAAIDAIAAMNAGDDVAALRRHKRSEPTLRDVWEHYKADHLTTRCTSKTIVAETALYRKHVQQFGTRRLNDITPTMVRRHHAKIGAKAPTSANRAVQMIGRLYRYATRHFDWSGELPTRTVELFRENPRERFLSADELPRFLAACDAEGQPWADFFRLCLLTGARRSNLQAMAWGDLDLSARRWTIGASESKNHRQMVVPLTVQAVEILTERRKRKVADDDERIRTSPFVFPVLRNKGKVPHISAPQRIFDRIIERAGITDIRMHDLRRSCGAMLAASGASLPMIGRILGHADLRATQIYARLDLAPATEALDTAMQAMPTNEVQHDPAE